MPISTVCVSVCVGVNHVMKRSKRIDRPSPSIFLYYDVGGCCCRTAFSKLLFRWAMCVRVRVEGGGKRRYMWCRQFVSHQKEKVKRIGIQQPLGQEKKPRRWQQQNCRVECCTTRTVRPLRRIQVAITCHTQRTWNDPSNSFVSRSREVQLLLQQAPLYHSRKGNVDLNLSQLNRRRRVNNRKPLKQRYRNELQYIRNRKLDSVSWSCWQEDDTIFFYYFFELEELAQRSLALWRGLTTLLPARPINDDCGGSRHWWRGNGSTFCGEAQQQSGREYQGNQRDL